MTQPVLVSDAPSSTDLLDRCAVLSEAVAHGRGRLPEETLNRLDAVLERAQTRLTLSSAHTVVALAGATGSGKSSTFNALTEMELAAVGVRRPTTSWTMACVWGREGADELLDFVGIAERHRVSHDSLLDDPERSKELQGLVLLDLPDHDSTQTAHHAEVDRVVAVADLMVWVLDPQKYADQAIHARYLRRLNAHRDIMMVVLNHIDEVKPRKVGAMVADLERLLAEDGLAGIPVMTTSAKFGQGISELRTMIAERVQSRGAANDRVSADLAAVEETLAQLLGAGPVPQVLDSEHEETLVNAVSEAAGINTALRFVEARDRENAQRYFRWPLLPRATSGATRGREAHQALGVDVAALSSETPGVGTVERSRVNRAVRDGADAVSADLPAGWARSVDAAATGDLEAFNDDLDAVLEAADVASLPIPGTWKAARVLKWVSVLALVCGLGWAGFAVSQGDPITLPLGLAAAAVAFGLLLSWRGQSAAAWAAGQHAAATRRELTATITASTREHITNAMQREMDALHAARVALNRL